MSSVKKKRRAKMAKHKRKKRSIDSTFSPLLLSARQANKLQVIEQRNLEEADVFLVQKNI